MSDRSIFNPPQVMAADGVAPVHLNPKPGRLPLVGLELDAEEGDDEPYPAASRTHFIFEAA